ncbi:carboxy terminal-processing peptidase [Ignatzschineria rhizosphaerae]|uniref:Carboxy terminal-processing peptidase n=1 Tax=Ignatzschineria rhizosphaerae TaxID=2923279 RepID=A0ABY3X2J1_9GAMM|nr:carboxy terminal-processing peptidase [Ignatzschineria rhizosphaerae]UNM97103.1 carboxy terminal-processing peptidase [Ignatzschineria rhizosphaerae]
MLNEKKFVKSQFAKIVSSALIATSLLWGGLSIAAKPNNDIEKRAVIAAPSYNEQLINSAHSAILAQYHYDRLPIDNVLSERIYTLYLKALDPQKVFFTQSDIDGFEQYRYQFDDFVKRSQLDVPYDMYRLLLQRMDEQYALVKELLAEDYDFDVDKKIIIQRKDEAYAKDQAALRSLWKDRLQNELINLMVTDEKLSLAEAKEKLQKRYNTRSKRIHDMEEGELFSLVMNVISLSFDPHSGYYSAKQMEQFNISMSLSLQGIGTVLRQDDDSVKIVEVVTGGPADLTGQVQIGDEIIGVAQGEDGEFVDIVGMRLDKVVEMVRGEKGTTVRLQMIGNKGKGAEKIVKIIRDTVKLEEQEAKSEVFNMPSENGKEEYKLGVITLPAFYSDFEGSKQGVEDFKSTTRDVKKLLLPLINEEDIDGLVIDLRGNGGGSLTEVIDLSALFIGSNKTVVQTRGFDGNTDAQGSTVEDLIYSGPMVVLVDRLSASASEIFAGSMQDQGRAVIAGSTSFGKGTVQTMIDLSRILAKSTKPGQSKVTIAKFYRANGETTQEKGVVPDVTLPSSYDPTEIGEAKEMYVMSWDTIEAAPDYDPSVVIKPSVVDKLQAKSSARFKTDEKHQIYQRQANKTLDLWKINELSLNLQARKEKLKAEEAENLELQNRMRVLYDYEPLTLEEFRNEDGTYTKLLKDTETDLILEEGLLILRDVVDLQHQKK